VSVTLYPFICTKTTYSLNVPQYAATEADHRRKVHNAFNAIGSGFRRAGDCVLRFTTDAIDDHLFCDGSTLQITSFPQLYAVIGTRFGGDGVTTFALPDTTAGVLFTATAPTQTVSDGGTVSTGGTVTTPTDPGQTGGTTGGNVSSGGRPRNPDERIP
jgi:hypothetical protein